jgi:hypothetical protein
VGQVEANFGVTRERQLSILRSLKLHAFRRSLQIHAEQLPKPATSDREVMAVPRKNKSLGPQKLIRRQIGREARVLLRFHIQPRAPDVQFIFRKCRCRRRLGPANRRNHNSRIPFAKRPRSRSTQRLRCSIIRKRSARTSLFQASTGSGWMSVPATRASGRTSRHAANSCASRETLGSTRMFC